MYDPRKYPNPALQWHYKILQAMALDEEIPTEEDDKTKPKFRQIDKRAGHMIQQWNAMLQEEFRSMSDNGRQKIGTKRERDIGEDEEEGDPKPASKKAKAKATKTSMSQGLEGVDVNGIKELVENDKLGKYTIADLKAWLRGKGLSEVGKKKELVERVEEWVENH